MPDTTYSIDKLIQINSEGIQVADYREIVSALIQDYRNIYGSDIDVDPRTGDGRFIYSVATVINSGLNVISQLYNNLNPSVASGNFLDILCSLTNVTRRAASKSIAKVNITNTDSKEDIIIKGKDVKINLNLIDDSGNIWECIDSRSDLKVSANTTISLIYECTEAGKITTSSLRWEELNNTNLKVSLNTISLGSNVESDSSLRLRRETSSNNGLTVLGSLEGALMGISGIKDAYIQSYAANKDETSVVLFNGVPYPMSPHSVAILLRYDSVNKPSSAAIAEVIKNYLTPGITSYQRTMDSASGAKSETIINYSLGTSNSYHWAVCAPVHPTITINIFPLANFAGQSTLNVIAEQIVSYLNNLKISQTYSYSKLQNIAQTADPRSSNLPTYVIQSVSLPANANAGTYFDYSSYEVSELQSNNTFKITYKE